MIEKLANGDLKLDEQNHLTKNDVISLYLYIRANYINEILEWYDEWYEEDYKLRKKEK